MYSALFPQRIAFLLTFFALFLFSGGKASKDSTTMNGQPSGVSKELTIGVKHSPPFMIKTDQGFNSGVSHDLWRRISEDLGWEYEYKEFDLVGLLKALENEEIDLCINPLTVTSERMEKMDFSQPFYISNLAIAVPKEKQSEILLFLSNIFSLNFLSVVLLLIIVILIFGLLVWAAEKKANPEMFSKGWKGVWDGFWWSAVTMTTVGYGDKAPKTGLGKILGIVWMFTAVIIISSFTASIASSLTVQKTSLQIEDLSDLKHVTTGTVKGSNSEKFLLSKKIQPETFSSLEDALEELRKGRISALVYDEPLIRYMIQNNGLSNRIKVLKNTFNKQHYSFAVPKESPLMEKLNLQLLKELESENWTAILKRYNL